MRKRYLSVLIIALVLVVAIVYYLTLPTTPPNIFNEPQGQGNETQGNIGPIKFPFRFPWQTTQTTKEGGEAPSSGSSSGSSGGSSSGGGSSTNQTIEEPRINYTLSLNSFPEGLRIFTSYYINDVKSSLTSNAPFDLQADANSAVCVLPAYITGSGVLKWTLDGEDCEFSNCEGSSYGCLITMDTNHLVTLYYTPIT